MKILIYFLIKKNEQINLKISFRWVRIKISITIQCVNSIPSFYANFYWWSDQCNIQDYNLSHNLQKLIINEYLDYCLHILHSHTICNYKK